MYVTPHVHHVRRTTFLVLGGISHEVCVANIICLGFFCREPRSGRGFAEWSGTAVRKAPAPQGAPPLLQSIQQEAASERSENPEGQVRTMEHLLLRAERTIRTLGRR